MKKKMIRNGIIFAVLIALLGAGVRALRATRPDEEENVTEIPVYTGEKAAVKEISVQNALGEFTLLKGADGETWEMKGEPSIPVYQTKASNLAYTVSSVHARSIAEEKAENLVPYGLASPAATVTVRLSGGETNVYYLGNDLPIGSEAYFMMEGDPTVYTVTTVSWGDVKLAKNAFYDMTLPEFPASESVIGITVHRASDTLLFERSETEDGYSAEWAMTSPIERAADNGAVEGDILSTLGSLRAINVFAPDEAPEDIGMGTLRVTLSLKGEEEITYSFGTATGEGTYMKMTGSELLYLVSTGSLEALKDEPFRYMSKVLLSPHIESVRSVTVTVEGETHVLTLGDPNLLDETGIGEEKARSIYGAVIGLTANGIRTKEASAPDGQNEIVFCLEDGTVKVLSFGETDGRVMAVYEDGESLFTVSKKDLTGIRDLMQ